MSAFDDAIKRRLGIIQSIGTDATEQQGARLARQRAQERAAQAATAIGSLPQGNNSANSSGGARWEDFGLELQRLGYKVSENPDPRFGGRVGKHSEGSPHYSGRAFDVNWAPGTSKAEQDMLRKAAALAKNYGIPQTIFMQPGHYGHAHFGW